MFQCPHERTALCGFSDGKPRLHPPPSQQPTDGNQGDLLSHECQNLMGCLSKTQPACMDWNLNPWGWGGNRYLYEISFLDNYNMKQRTTALLWPLHTPTVMSTDKHTPMKWLLFD